MTTDKDDTNDNIKNVDNSYAVNGSCL